MFANRFRRAALALSGATLIATGLLTPIAAAAPIGLPTGDAALAKPRIDLPRADIQVTPRRVERSGGTITYVFNVKNTGPDNMMYQMRTRSYYHYAGSSQMQVTEHVIEAGLNNGFDTEVKVVCNTGHICYSGHLSVDKLHGIDTNMNNNLAVMHEDDY